MLEERKCYILFSELFGKGEEACPCKQASHRQSENRERNSCNTFGSRRILEHQHPVS